MSDVAEERPKRRVLIVEDDEAGREALRRCVERAGYVVTTAETVPQAMGHLVDGLRPDAVLLDYMLPGLNGGAFLRALRNLALPVRVAIVTAAWESVEKNPDVAALTPDAILRKPLIFADVLDFLEARQTQPRD